MSWKLKLATAGLAAAASVLVAQETPTTTSQSTQQQTTEQTRNPDGSMTTSTKTTTVTGEVVQYEPGKTIVIRDPNSKTVTYTIDSSLAVPSDVQVGRKVTIYTSPADGSLRVQRISTVQTTSPDGSSTAKTEVRDEPGSMSGSSSTAGSSKQMSSSSGQTTTTTSQSQAQTSTQPQAEPPADSKTTTTTRTTKMTTVSGTIQAYTPGQSITIVGPGNKTTVYTIAEDSKLPSDLVVGKQVTLQTTMVSGKPVVRSVTTRTTTVKTQTKSVSPQ